MIDRLRNFHFSFNILHFAAKKEKKKKRRKIQARDRFTAKSVVVGCHIYLQVGKATDSLQLLRSHQLATWVQGGKSQWSSYLG